MKPNKKMRVSQALTAAALLAGISAPVVETYIVSQSDSALRVYAKTGLSTAIANFAKLYSNRDYKVLTASSSTIVEGQKVWLTLTNANGDIVNYLPVVATADNLAILNDSKKLSQKVLLSYVKGEFKAATIDNMVADGGVGTSDVIITISKLDIIAKTADYTSTLAKIIANYEKNKSSYIRTFLYSTAPSYGIGGRYVYMQAGNVALFSPTSGDNSGPEFIPLSALSEGIRVSNSEFWNVTEAISAIVENSTGDGDFYHGIEGEVFFFGLPQWGVQKPFSITVEWKDGNVPSPVDPGTVKEYSFRLTQESLSGRTTVLTDWETVKIVGKPSDADASLPDWAFDSNSVHVERNYEEYTSLNIRLNNITLESITYDDTEEKAKGCIPLPKDNVNGN